MLYDILIIDNDFDPDEGTETGEGNNANELLRDLVRDNLRVTWTTGEKADLERLGEKDLSRIKYIFLDLHLQGTEGNASYKTINSKIIGIVNKIDNRIDTESVTIFVNSKYIDDNYGEDGIDNLKSTLASESDKFTVDTIQPEKNKLTEEQRSVLHRTSIHSNARNYIIASAIKVEEALVKRLDIPEYIAEELTLNLKYRIFKNRFECGGKLGEHFTRLQKMRNVLAHRAKNKDIAFDSFDDLYKYLRSIDELIKWIEEAKERKQNQATK